MAKRKFCRECGIKLLSNNKSGKYWLCRKSPEQRAKEVAEDEIENLLEQEKEGMFHRGEFL